MPFEVIVAADVFDIGSKKIASHAGKLLGYKQNIGSRTLIPVQFFCNNVNAK